MCHYSHCTYMQFIADMVASVTEFFKLGPFRSLLANGLPSHLQRFLSSLQCVAHACRRRKATLWNAQGLSAVFVGITLPVFASSNCRRGSGIVRRAGRLELHNSMVPRSSALSEFFCSFCVPVDDGLYDHNCIVSALFFIVKVSHYCLVVTCSAHDIYCAIFVCPAFYESLLLSRHCTVRMMYFVCLIWLLHLSSFF